MSTMKKTSMARKMRTIRCFVSAITFIAAISTSMAEDGFIKGGQFVDLILPIGGTVEATDADWGTRPGSYDKKGQICTWAGTLGRWKDNGIEDDARSYWGGNALRGDDGNWHLFVAGWPESSPKGHGSWMTGSKCYHGVSASGPDRGFVFKEELGPGHNTEAYRVKDGRTVVYNIERRYVSNKPRLDENTAWTESRFEWDLRDRRLARGPDRNISLSNCTFARRSDGSFLMMDRGGCVWVSRDGIDAYHQLTDHTAYAGNRTRFLEDPVIWFDGFQYFMIVNDYDARQACFNRSLDGIHWIIEPGVAYKTGVVKHADGKVEQWDKLERPKVQLDKYGRATHIHLAVVDSEKDADKGSDTHSSKNIVAPLVKFRYAKVLSPLKFKDGTSTYKVKIFKEEDFDPSQIEISSLVFGSSSLVNRGEGYRALDAKSDAKGNLVVTFGGGAGECGITANEWSPKFIGSDKKGNIVCGYACLPWVNYRPAVVSAMLPVANDENYITSVKINNYGLSSCDGMDVKVTTADGTVLSSGVVHPIAPYGFENVRLEGASKPAPGLERICVVFYKDGVEIDRNTFYPDNINSQRARLATMTDEAKAMLEDATLTEGRKSLQEMCDASKSMQERFNAEAISDFCGRLEQAMDSFLLANGIVSQKWSFYDAALRNAAINMNLAERVENADGHCIPVADNIVYEDKTIPFAGRVAFDYGGGQLALRNNGESMSNTGLFNYNKDAYFSVLDLRAGDEVVFNLRGNTPPAFVSSCCHAKDDPSKRGCQTGDPVISGRTYIMSGNEGEKLQLDVVTRHFACIDSIIVRTKAERE